MPIIGYSRTFGNSFPGGNQTAGSIKEFVEAMAVYSGPSVPTAGGTLTINSAALGSYDYSIKDGSQTVSSFNNTDWFTTTADSRSAFIVVKGNLTINSGQTFIPSNRKLFTVIYVTGNLSVAGSISMSARGANHSASGGNVTAAAIRIATGTFSGVVNPQVPAAGAAGGAGVSASGPGNVGSNGTNGQTGGGASGGRDGLGTSGAGAAGTSFSGGTAGGGVRNNAGTAGSGNANGAAGGAALAGDRGAGGGAGNPGGALAGSGQAGVDGTGGVLLIIVAGALSGAGTIVAAGSNGGSDGGSDGAGGGASGGGSITVMYGSDSSSITPSAPGGTGGTAVGTADGGNGGSGTARKLQI